MLQLPSGSSFMAVSDAGSILASALRPDGSVAVQLLTNGGTSFETVTTLSKFGGMAFLPGKEAVLMADAGTNSVLEASQMSGNMSLAQIAGPGDGVSQPLAVGISADGHSAAIANTKNSTIIRIDLSGQSSATRTTCGCSPTELIPLAGNLAFRLNDAGSGTVWAFDGDAPTPRVVFIPSDEVANNAQSTSR